MFFIVSQLILGLNGEIISDWLLINKFRKTSVEVKVGVKWPRINIYQTQTDIRIGKQTSHRH
jgi:hypothetical protein